MAQHVEPNEETLFHLVPDNQASHDVLYHPHNRRFVSSSAYGYGLEIGYHVPTIPSGHVITRLGRRGDLSDLVLPNPSIVSRHIAFEINPTTHLVLLDASMKRDSVVKFAILNENPSRETEEDTVMGETTTGEAITGQGVLLYMQNYLISIETWRVCYKFRLIWRITNERRSKRAFKTFTFNAYNRSLQRLRYVETSQRPTEINPSEARSWYITRLNSTRGPTFQDIPRLRKVIGAGSFGAVYATVDLTTGYQFAIKVVDLNKQNTNIDNARAALHREVKILERLKHDNIIEYLGIQHFDTDFPEIFMPLCTGSLTSLARSPPNDMAYDVMCTVALGHMLSALDCLSYHDLIHRDVKPDNVLYTRVEGKFVFQLADFGLVNHVSKATTICGTGYYQAPEFHHEKTGVTDEQTHKCDVWSLVACIVAVLSRFEHFPPRTNDYMVVLNSLRTLVQTEPILKILEPMARLHPEHRASAAQMLDLHFEGKGLTTQKSNIPPIGPDSPVSTARARPQRYSKRLQEAKAKMVVYDRLKPNHPPNLFLNRGGNLGKPGLPQYQQPNAPNNGIFRHGANAPAQLPWNDAKVGNHVAFNRPGRQF